MCIIRLFHKIKFISLYFYSPPFFHRMRRISFEYVPMCRQLEEQLRSIQLEEQLRKERKRSEQVTYSVVIFYFDFIITIVGFFLAGAHRSPTEALVPFAYACQTE